MVSPVYLNEIIPLRPHRGCIVASFLPIAEDRLSPDVKNPHRLRVLFKKRTRS
jgi:hypothetical protein